jgi:hypothetical protein
MSGLKKLPNWQNSLPKSDKTQELFGHKSSLDINLVGHKPSLSSDRAECCHWSIRTFTYETIYETIYENQRMTPTDDLDLSPQKSMALSCCFAINLLVSLW